MATFFNIQVPPGTSPREWAKRMWDHFGFDFDLERCTAHVLAWAYEISDEQLKQNLEEEGIQYSTFEIDDDKVDAFFGLDKE